MTVGLTLIPRFCVRAGARHVYATDVSNMIHNARKIAAVNGMSSKITFIQGKVEFADLPPVDVIVSEWMGFCLLSEIMLDCLLQARDKYLVPGGLLFPDRVSAYVAGIEDAERVDSKVTCKCERQSDGAGHLLLTRLSSVQRLERHLRAELQPAETSGH